MAEITVSRQTGRVFDVRVRDDGQERTYRVEVPQRIVGGPDLADEDLERVVRESFVFLLEREPASSIMAEFTLDVITRYFPEYPAELARRLT
jgi:hypothetical protein